MNNDFGVVEITRILVARKWSVIGGMLLMLALCGAWIAISPPRYTADATLLVEKQNVGLPGVIGPQAFATDNNIFDQLALLSSSRIAGRVIESLKLHEMAEFNREHEASSGSFYDLTEIQQTSVIRAFQDGLQVSNTEDSNIAMLTFTSESPVRAAAVANAIVKQYLELSSEEVLTRSDRTRAWLVRRTEDLQDAILDSENQLVSLRQATKLPISASDLSEQELAELKAQLLALSSERTSLTAQLSQARRLRNLDPALLLSSDAVNRSPAVRTLVERSVEAQKSIAQLRTEYGPKHPNMLSALAQQQDLQRQLVVEASRLNTSLRRQLNVVQNREQRLRGQFSSASEKVTSSITDSMDAARIERDLDTKRELLGTLLGHRMALESREGVGYGGPAASIITPAMTPHEPSSPSRIGLLIFAIFAGMIFGMLWAFVREMFDTSIHSAHDLQNNTSDQRNLAVVAQIPKGSTTTGSGRYPIDLLLRKPQTPFAKAVRNANWNLRLRDKAVSSSSTSGKSILVTSARAGEGKTLFATSLARSSSLSGQRVLIIDVNFYNPSVYNIMGIRGKAEGASTLLNRKVPFYRLLSMDKSSGAHVLGPGRMLPDPAMLFSHPVWRKAIRFCESKYDRVIIDAPPLDAGPDSLLIANLVNSTLLVSDCRKSKVDDVYRSVDYINQYTQGQTSVVLNKLRHVEPEFRYLQQTEAAQRTKTAYPDNVTEIIVREPTGPAARTEKAPKTAAGNVSTQSHADAVLESLVQGSQPPNRTPMSDRSRAMIRELAKLAEKKRKQQQPPRATGSDA